MVSSYDITLIVVLGIEAVVAAIIVVNVLKSIKEELKDG